MSAVERVSPVWSVVCDFSDCRRLFVPDGVFDRREPNTARRQAAETGWQVRPHAGRGMYSAPDYCPEHRTDGVERRTSRYRTRREWPMSLCGEGTDG